MIVDESHTFVTGASRKDRELCESNVWYLTKLAKEGRSRGFLTVFVTQKQTADAIPTAIRDVCQVGISFGVRTMDGAVAALGDDIRQYPDVAPTLLIGREWTGVGVMRLPDRAGYHRVRTPHVTESDAAQLVEANAGEPNTAHPSGRQGRPGRRAGSPMIAPLATIDAGDEAELVRAASQPGFNRWRGHGGRHRRVRRSHPPGRPIGLIDAATGEVLNHYNTEDEPNRRLLVACRNRRASRCAPCAELYRADTYQLIRAGLAGGKTVPDTVAGHPRIFATLTAPSFGPVHHRVVNPDGSVQRCHPGAGCNRRHDADDPCLGQAVDPDRYDYRGAVIWNALAGVLWHRTTTLVVRHLARHLGVTEKEFRRRGRVSYGKVAEFQTRGVVHFHVIIRLDGPDGPDQPPPEGLSVDV